MADKMEPVATYRRSHNGNTWLQFTQPNTNLPDQVSLYTADQVKELTDRLDKAELELADMTADYLRRHKDAGDFMERAIVAESALAEARKVIDGLLACPAIADVNHTDPAWGCAETAKAESAARSWLSANPAKGGE